MKLSEKDKQNIIDALKEWEESVGFKELDEEDVGLNHDRYVNLMRRLGVTGDIENNFSWDNDPRETIIDVTGVGYSEVLEGFLYELDEKMGSEIDYEPQEGGSRSHMKARRHDLREFCESIGIKGAKEWVL